MSKERKKVLGVIPARLGSARIHEKMLKLIAGKTLIERTIERTLEAKSLDAILIATDSERIAEIVRPLGVSVMLTPPEIPTGTDRVCYAVERYQDFSPEIVVNIWGDEPLYPPEAINKCVAMMLEDDDLQVGGVADLIENPAMCEESSIVQVLTDPKGNAMYFSRASVPYRYNKDADYDNYHVIGVMAMRRSFLKSFTMLPRTPIECVEGVEQMRILEHGFRMRMVKGQFRNLGVNTPEELEQVREIFEKTHTKETRHI